MNDLETVALGIGLLYLTGRLGLARDIVREIGEGVATATGDIATETVRTAARTIPAADEEGVGRWTIPVSGGTITGNPLSLLGEVGAHPEMLWNALPILPDYTGQPLQKTLSDTWHKILGW